MFWIQLFSNFHLNWKAWSFSWAHMTFWLGVACWWSGHIALWGIAIRLQLTWHRHKAETLNGIASRTESNRFKFRLSCWRAMAGKRSIMKHTVLWNRYDVRWVRGATIKFPGFSRFKGTFKHWHLTSLIIASKSKDGYVLVDNCLGYNTVSKYMEMDQSFILYSPIHDNIKHNIILKLELQKIQGIEASDFFKQQSQDVSQQYKLG